MSQISVRRSGLVTFGIKLGSTLTGLAFIVLVTSNLSIPDFGLWQLISKTIGYVIFPLNILSFWAIRYRARGRKLGKTILTAAALFSVVLSVAYCVVSLGVARSMFTPGGYEYNLFFFLVSAPQVPLYIIIGVIEGILWGSTPEKASLGFGIFEIAKVIIGWAAIAIFKLSLEGAVFAIMGAQSVQLISVLFFTRREYDDKVSIPLFSSMLKNGWVAALNNLQPLVVTLDFLIVTLMTNAYLPVAYFGAAYVFAGIITYSGWIATGLYAGVLSGKEPGKYTTQTLELQYLFIVPMVLGEILLAAPLMHLLNKSYTTGYPILIVLALAYGLTSIGMTFDYVISSTDTTDVNLQANFSVYLRSKLFLLSKINLGLSVGYLVSVGIISKIIDEVQPQIFGLSWYNILGVGWAVAALGMGGLGLLLKLTYVRAVATLSVPRSTLIAIVVGALGFVATLYPISIIIQPHGGELMQVVYLFTMGIPALAVYAALVLALSKPMRQLARTTLATIF